MIYLDHNATTPVRPEVRDAMLPWLTEFGNPNSVYKAGQKARAAVEEARRRVAALLGAKSESEIVFTSCGSEADVLGIAGAAWQAFDESAGKRNRIVSTPIEHDAVRGVLNLLKKRGFQVDLLPVDKHGMVDAAAAKALITERTAVVSVMHANNEVGTLQPVEALAKLCRESSVLFHTDAVQSAGKVDISRLGADLIAISGHKLNAPKGVGALYVRSGVRLSPLITGHQEKNRRGGTENVAGIVAFGKACELAKSELGNAAKYKALIEKAAKGVLAIPGTRRNGHPEKALPNCAHFSFEGLDGHHLVVALDLDDICVSSGPACSTGSSVPSHVLTAMGIPENLATGSLRLSVGYGSTEADVEKFLKVLPRVVEKLRAVPV